MNNTFYQVITDLYHAPLPDHLTCGYESRQDFMLSLRALVDRWHGRIGESIVERHGFRYLRFHDTLGGKPDEAWIPNYLLKPIDKPEYMKADEDETVKELDVTFGFV